MRCIDDEDWEYLKRHTAAHLRSRTWLGGAFSVISANGPPPGPYHETPATTGEGGREDSRDGEARSGFGRI